MSQKEKENNNMIQTSPKEFIHCEICGVLQEKTTGNRKYCDKCREDAYKIKSAQIYRAAYKKKQQERERVRNKKTLTQMAAEAQSYGMTYGQYSVALKNGTFRNGG